MTSRVKSIRRLPGTHQVYDLSVEGPHTFFANGVAVHNCDTTGIEPDFALVKFKKLAGGGYFKIINQSIPAALAALGYHPDQVRSICAYALGHGTLKDAPEIDHTVLRAHGMNDEDLSKIEAALPTAFDLRGAVNGWTLGPESMKRLGFIEKQWQAMNFDLLRRLGFTRSQINHAETYACGAMTLEGAPHLDPDHYAVFDTANRCGKIGKRFIHPHGHLRMMASAQSFISGAISKTINLPNEATEGEIGQTHMLGWKLGLKAVALYRDGCKLSQPLSTSSDSEKDDEAESTIDQLIKEGSDPSILVTRDATSGFATTVLENAAPNTTQTKLRAPKDGETMESATTQKLSQDEVLKIVADAAGFTDEVEARERDRRAGDSQPIPVVDEKIAPKPQPTAIVPALTEAPTPPSSPFIDAAALASSSSELSSNVWQPKPQAAPAPSTSTMTTHQLMAELRRVLKSGNPQEIAKLREELSNEVGRRQLPRKRRGFTQKAKVAGHTIFVRTGEYDDGTLGEIFVDMHKEGAAFRSLLNCFAIAVSIGLQYGVPLEEYVDKFIFTRFEPAGMADHPNIRKVTSVVDYIFRLLAMEYLKRYDIVQNPPVDVPKGHDAGHDHTPELSHERPQPTAHVHPTPPPVSIPDATMIPPVIHGAPAVQAMAPAPAVPSVAATMAKPAPTPVAAPEPELAAVSRLASLSPESLDVAARQAIAADLPGLLRANGKHSNGHGNGHAHGYRPNLDADPTPIQSALAGPGTPMSMTFSPQQQLMASLMGDAPPCPECGSIMRRNGACYVCPECGTQGGCG